MKLPSRFLGFSLFILGTLVAAQETKPAQAPPPQRPPALVTPEVHSDHSVTFRFLAPNAQAVKLAREGAEPVAMQKDETGVWSVTTAPLPPDYYGYSLAVDGVRSLDPNNHGLTPNLIAPGNFVHVPAPSLPWEVKDVPHGEVHHHFYRSGWPTISGTSTSTRLPVTIPRPLRRIQFFICCTDTATMPAGGPQSGVPT